MQFSPLAAETRNCYNNCAESFSRADVVLRVCQAAGLTRRWREWGEGSYLNCTT